MLDSIKEKTFKNIDTNNNLMYYMLSVVFIDTVMLYCI